LESDASPNIPSPVSKKSSKNQKKGGPKNKRSKKARVAPTTLSEVVEVSSEEESDGQSALRAVQEEEIRAGAKRGPQGRTRLHWHIPRTTIEEGTKSKRWLFKCRYCDA
jgi:hypothetical protein